MSSNEFLIDGDSTPSMINEIYSTAAKSAFQNRAGGGRLYTPITKENPPRYEFDPKDFPPEGDDNISVYSEEQEQIPKESKKEEKKAVAPRSEKKGGPNLSVDKVTLQKIYICIV